MNYDDFFRAAFNGAQPYNYQGMVAVEDPLPAAINVPTGAGKTAAVIGAWLWRRVHRPETVGTRLIYCLPMRVLVEQTKDVASDALERLEKTGLFRRDRFRVYTLMGGDVENEWDIYPEREFILIGTQDMLLSRALNRGYAMSRFRWPLHFGLLNNDAFWVIDEIQLMGSGFSTTLQLDEFRRRFGSYMNVRTLWMSATLESAWFKTVDFDPGEHLNILTLDPKKDIEASQELQRRLEATKPLKKAAAKAGETEKLAKEILKAHKPGSRTLVVLNTVKRARELHEEIETIAKARQVEAILIHSRFRQDDRKKILERVLSKPASAGTIIISTQVIEAGVDFSAKVLFTELAPWASLVQRFGRCNREGNDNEESIVSWIDVSTKGKNSLAAPYDAADLDDARTTLMALDSKDVGPKSLIQNLSKMKHENKLNNSPPDDRALLPPSITRYEHNYVIRQHDVHCLFSTEPDLSGGFTDISHFVRNRERVADVLVFWREFKKMPGRFVSRARHDELCTVRLWAFKEFLEKNGKYCWEWNGESGNWEKRYSDEIRAGMTLLLHYEQGGYSSKLGWTGDSSDRPTVVDAFTQPEEFIGDDQPSQTDWLSLSDHLSDAEAEARQITMELGLTESDEGKAVIRAARWHDIGKLHRKWQEAVEDWVQKTSEKISNLIDSNGPLNEMEFANQFSQKLNSSKDAAGPWAKFPDLKLELDKLPNDLRRSLRKRLYLPFVPKMRHEVASTLEAWRGWRAGEDGWTALALYLIACHHGKVRTVLRSTASDQDAFGVHSGDKLPSLVGWLSSDRELDASIRAVGTIGNWTENGFTTQSPSWMAMIAELLGPELPEDPVPSEVIPNTEPRNLGPFRLAYLEALVIAADRRASRNPNRTRKGLENE